MKECVATKVKQYTRKGHIYICTIHLYSRPLGNGDTRDIAGLKCRNLTYDMSPQCRGCAGGGGDKFPPKKEFV